MSLRGRKLPAMQVSKLLKSSISDQASLDSVLLTLPCCFQHCLNDSICISKGGKVSHFLFIYHCRLSSPPHLATQSRHRRIRSTYLVFTRPPVLLLIETVIQLGVLLCNSKCISCVFLSDSYCARLEALPYLNSQC